MATALQLSIDREHPELEDIEKHDQDNDRSSGSAYSQNRSPSLVEYMHYAAQARELERRLSTTQGSENGTPPESKKAKTPSEKSSSPIIDDEELLTARRALRNASWAGIFYLITTDILGPFNAPFAFSQVGYVPGAVLYIIMGVVACYTGLILWKLFCKLDSDQYPIKTYADISERIFGTWFKHLCSILQSLQLIINVGTICLGNAQSVEQIARNHQFCFSAAIIIWAGVGMVIGQIRSLKQYGWLANSAVFLNIFILIVTMAVVAHTPPNFASALAAFGRLPGTDENGVGPVLKAKFVGLPLFDKVNGIMQMVFAYGGAMIFPEFMAEMRRPMDFWKSMCCAQLLIGTIYMIFGLVVYSFQGQFTLPLAFQGMSSFGWQTLGNVIALITGIIAAGLYGNIGIKVAYYHIVEQWLNGPPLLSKKGRIVWTFMVIVYWALAFIVGSAIPQVQTISGLVAAICIMQFTYSFPPLLLVGFHWKLDKAHAAAKLTAAAKPKSEIGTGSADSPGAPSSPDVFVTKEVESEPYKPWPWYFHAFNIILGLGSLAMAALGMYGSGKAIQATFQAGGAATSFGCGSPV